MKRNTIKQKVKNNLPYVMKVYIWIFITYLVVNVLIKQARIESAQQINMDYPALGDD